jgi:hypothetical protein
LNLSARSPPAVELFTGQGVLAVTPYFLTDKTAGGFLFLFLLQKQSDKFHFVFWERLLCKKTGRSPTEMET